MLLNDIYENNISFDFGKEIEFSFHESGIRYLVDVILDNGVSIKDIYSAGSTYRVGKSINLSTDKVEVIMYSNKLLIRVTGKINNNIRLNIRQGIINANYITKGMNITGYVTTKNIPYGISLNGDSLMVYTDKNEYTESMTATEDKVLLEVDRLLDIDFNNRNYLYENYIMGDEDQWRDKFAYVNKLGKVRNNDTKQGLIDSFVDTKSISDILLQKNTIDRSKLDNALVEVLDLADTSLQNFRLNGVNYSGKNVSIKSLIELSMGTGDTSGSWGMDSPTLDINDSLDINDDGHKMQYYIKHNNNLNHFLTYDGYGKYGYINMNRYFDKDELDSTTTDNTLWSSTNTKDKSDTLLDFLSSDISDYLRGSSTKFNINKLYKYSVNEEGQIVGSKGIVRDDLTKNMLDLTKSYQKSKNKKVVNNSLMTIFIIDEGDHNE